MSIRGAPVKLIGVVAAAVLAVVVLSTAYSTSILLAADDCPDTEPGELLTLHAYPDPEGIRICWGSNPPDIRGYRIYRGTTEDTIRGYLSGHWDTNYGAQWVEHPIPTFWVDQNTTPGQEYWYRVVLLDGNYVDTNEDGVKDHKGDEIARTTNVSMIAPVLGREYDYTNTNSGDLVSFIAPEKPHPSMLRQLPAPSTRTLPRTSPSAHRWRPPTSMSAIRR